MQILVILSTFLILSGCTTAPTTETSIKSYCIGGYQHSYTYNNGYRQIWEEHGKGVPCTK